MKGVIYCYYINKKYYVGKTYGLVEKRKDKHKFDALTKKVDTPFARAIRKYGWENVIETYEVLEYVYADSKQELNYKLIELVKFSNHKECLGVKDKNEVYKKISNSLKGKYLNEEYSSKKIICIELNKEFESLKDASEHFTGKRNQHSNISSAIKRNGTFRGYHFKYII
jgi:hypothetical protein